MAAAPDYSVYKIKAPNSDGPSHLWTIEYKEYMVGSFQVAATGVALNPDGTLVTPVIISGLEINTRYIIRATDEFCGASSTTDPFAYWTDDPGQPGEWRQAAITCQLDSVFELDSQIDGLSSPDISFYDAITGRVWFAEYDNPLGPVGSYLPDATTAAEITYYLAPLGTGGSNFFYSHAIDPEKRYIYIVGKSTSGMLAFNLATLTYTVVPFGTDNVNFNRVFVQSFGERIVCIDTTNARLIVIEKTGYTIVTNTLITAVPSGTSCLYGSPKMQQVGDEIWVAKNNSALGVQSPNIFRYNLDFTVLIGVIDITSNCALVATSNVFCKETWMYNGIYYILDSGTSKLMRIDPSDPSLAPVIFTFDNRGAGFNYTSLQLVIEPISGDTFLSGVFYNQLGTTIETAITYKWNFTLNQPTYVFPGTRFASLTRIADTNELHGSSPGKVAWSSDNVGWNTDGIIYKYTV